MSKIFTIIKNFLDHNLPKSCLTCDRFGTFGHYICSECAEQIIFGDGAQNINPANSASQRQLRLNSEIFIDGFEAVTHFGAPISDLIKALKYDGVESIAFVLGEWLWHWAQVPWSIDFVCHVPLHWQRYVDRGFNQAQLIAHTYAACSQMIHLPVLERQKITRTQASANAIQRQNQLQGIFQVREKYIESVKDKNLLIIDDVMTTGNTFNECARALKEAGARQVYALALAHGS